MMWTSGGQIDHLAFAGLRGGGKGGGGGQSQSFSTSSTTLPDWLNTASQGAVQQATALSQRPYQAYGGQMVADPGADTNAAYQAVRDMQGQYDPSYAAAAGAQQGVLGNLQSLTPEQQNAATNALMGNYQQNVINPATGLLGGYAAQGPATAGQVASNALQIMSPFSQAVIDPALQIGRQQLQQNLQNIGAGANQAGAFGGSRQGVQEGVAQSQAAVGAGQTIGNLLNSGWQTAMNPATQVALQGGAQGYGAAGTLAGLYSGGYGASQQAAQNMLGTNLQLGETAAQQMPQIAAAQQAADQKNASLMQSIGAAQQNQQQQQLNAQMGQFYEQQNQPVQNLDVLLSSLGAVPYGSTTTSYGTQQAPAQQRNAAAGALGGAASGASIGMMFGPIGAGIGAAAGGLLGGLG
jgi:hypothetical protein